MLSVVGAIAIWGTIYKEAYWWRSCSSVTLPAILKIIVVLISSVISSIPIMTLILIDNKFIKLITDMILNLIQILICCQFIYDNLLFSWWLLMSWRRTVRIGVVIFFYRRRLWTLRSALKIFLSILENCDWDSYLYIYISMIFDSNGYSNLQWAIIVWCTLNDFYFVFAFFSLNREG